ncbi:hypothetical protein V1264_024900 [Littorina saxatilis]|uniref:Uncharacterized protein n=1 Tax=Littorina saxatilis TaxID=31220 RepID=A0AAN9FYT8_9CAEN
MAPSTPPWPVPSPSGKGGRRVLVESAAPQCKRTYPDRKTTTRTSQKYKGRRPSEGRMKEIRQPKCRVTVHFDRGCS